MQSLENKYSWRFLNLLTLCTVFTCSTSLMWRRYSMHANLIKASSSQCPQPNVKQVNVQPTKPGSRCDLDGREQRQGPHTGAVYTLQLSTSPWHSVSTEGTSRKGQQLLRALSGQTYTWVCQQHNGRQLKRSRFDLPSHSDELRHVNQVLFRKHISSS